jgi:ferritin-like protein
VEDAIMERPKSVARQLVENCSACPPAFLPEDPTNIRGMLDVLLKAEQCAVRGYTHICHLTHGKDHRTYDLSLAILHEEIEHEAWFAEFLGHGPSGHYSREGRPNSPYVGKFLNAGQ